MSKTPFANVKDTAPATSSAAAPKRGEQSPRGAGTSQAKTSNENGGAAQNAAAPKWQPTENEDYDVGAQAPLAKSPTAANVNNEGASNILNNNDSDGRAQTSSALSPKRFSTGTPSTTNPRTSIDKTDAAEAIDRYSTKQRRLEYFRSGTDSDCEVHVPKNGAGQGSGNVCYKKFKCHRIFLATASEKLEQDVFQNKQWNGILQINGVSPESVEIFLEYIYTFEITTALVNLQIMGDIYILSTAYNMPEFLLAFANRLKDLDWPLSDIFSTFNLAFQHNLIDLESSCLGKILDSSAELKTQPDIMKLQIYAFNFLIQHWLATEALTRNEIIQLLQQYQLENELNFKNTKQFPHFTKIVKYFPEVLFDAEGLIYIPAVVESNQSYNIPITGAYNFIAIPYKLQK